MSDQPFTYKLTIEDFQRLKRAGTFDAYVRAELIDGAIYVTTTDDTEESPMNADNDGDDDEGKS